MNKLSALCLSAALMGLSALPAAAESPEARAWAAVAQVNEMAAEARARCAAGEQQTCGEGEAIAASSFRLMKDARNCETGRYPRTCARLAEDFARIDGMYRRYVETAGPERVRANRAALREQACLPLFGGCSDTGVVQATLGQ